MSVFALFKALKNFEMNLIQFSRTRLILWILVTLVSRFPWMGKGYTPLWLTEELIIIWYHSKYHILAQIKQQGNDAETEDVENFEQFYPGRTGTLTYIVNWVLDLYLQYWIISSKAGLASTNNELLCNAERGYNYLHCPIHIIFASIVTRITILFWPVWLWPILANIWNYLFTSLAHTDIHLTATNSKPNGADMVSSCSRISLMRALVTTRSTVIVVHLWKKNKVIRKRPLNTWCTYSWSGNGFDGFLITHLFHRIVILFLILRHKHLQGSPCVYRAREKEVSLVWTITEVN